MKLFIWRCDDGSMVFAIAKDVWEAREIIRANEGLESVDNSAIDCIDEEPEVHSGRYGIISK